MQVELNYHRGKLPVTVAPDWRATVVRKPAMPVLPDPSAAVAQALGQPVGAPPLADLAGTARRAKDLAEVGLDGQLNGHTVALSDLGCEIGIRWCKNFRHRDTYLSERDERESNDSH